MSMIAGYSPRPPPPLLAQARKIAPFSQEDMNHTSKAERAERAGLSKEMLRILFTILLPKGPILATDL